MEQTTAEKETFKVGDILWDSWGYDMTINDYCKIIALSPTGKTILCRMVKKVVKDDNGLGGGRSYATDEEYGDTFRLWIRCYDGKRLYFVGKYPYCQSGLKKNGMKEGSFTLWKGGEDYFNTYD